MRLSLTKYDSIELIIIIVPLPLSPLCLLFLLRLGAYTANLCVFYFYKLIGKLTPFLQLPGVHLPQSTTSGQFHHRRTAFSSQFRSKVGNILTKAADLRINLNIDGSSIDSKSHSTMLGHGYQVIGEKVNSDS